MSISIELARIGATEAYHDATGPNLYGFEPFFKSTNYPVMTMLEEIAKWQPLGMLTPRFACVNQEASDHFSDIRPSIMEICRSSRTTESIFIRGHNHIFICPRTWSLQEEPISPDHSNCPDVEANQYTESLIRYRSNIILDALVRWRLQQVNLPLPNPSGLNAMVDLNARDSYLSPQNYDAYISSKCLRQTVLRVLTYVGSGQKSMQQIS